MQDQKTAIIIVLVVLLVLVGGYSMMSSYGKSGGLFGCGYGYGNGSYGSGMMSGYGGIFGLLMMALVIAALVLFIIWLVKQLTSGERRRK